MANLPKVAENKLLYLRQTGKVQFSCTNGMYKGKFSITSTTASLIVAVTKKYSLAECIEALYATITRNIDYINTITQEIEG